MIRKATLAAVILAAGILAGCGTSTTGPDGSKMETMSGVSPSGYPKGAPRDAESPALGSSSEHQLSREEGHQAGYYGAQGEEGAAEKPAAKPTEKK